MVEAITRGPRLYGCYEATVTENNDPKRIVRVRVRPPEIAGAFVLAWARVMAPFAGPGHGLVALPSAGDHVMVIFEAGDANRPVVVGSLWNEPGGVSEIPEAAFEADPAGPKRGLDSVITASGNEVKEPLDGRDPSYPNNKVLASKSHTVELDDTPGSERISIVHKVAGMYVDVYEDGTLVLNAPGQRYVVVGVNDTEHVKNNKAVVVDGSYALSSKDHDVQATRRRAFLAQDDVNVTGNASLSVGGGWTIEVTGRVILSGAQVVLGGAGAQALLNQLYHAQVHATHVHTAPPGGGPTSPPTPPLPIPPTAMTQITRAS
jgi:uncharacterized protein involved in type VI secretion and phage assembly